GYREVEFAGYFGQAPRDVRALLDEHGLSAPSAHVSLAPDQWRAALDAAPVIGHRYVVVAWIPAEARRTLDDYKRIAESFNHAATAAPAGSTGSGSSRAATKQGSGTPSSSTTRRRTPSPRFARATSI